MIAVRPLGAGTMIAVRTPGEGEKCVKAIRLGGVCCLVIKIFVA
jgi:hypothetical protein